MERDAALDGIRGVAVLAVVLAHAGVPGLPGGGRGVDVFFVLSGYLITRLLRTESEATGRIKRLAFWRRRAVRLFPALVLMLTAYAVLGPIFLPQYAANLWRDIAMAGLYLNDYAGAFFPAKGALGHTWSLAIEEQFYLIWPFVTVWLTRRKPDTAIRCLVGLWGLITFGRIAIVATTHSWEAAYLPLHAHASGLVLGALITFLPRPPPWSAWLGLTALALLMVLEPSSKTAQVVWCIPVAEGASALLIAGLGGRLARLLSWRPLSALGLISYGVYLFHLPINEAIDTGWPVKLAFTLVLSVCLATVSFLTVERWAKRLRGGSYTALGSNTNTSSLSGSVAVTADARVTKMSRSVVEYKP